MPNFFGADTSVFKNLAEPAGPTEEAKRTRKKKVKPRLESLTERPIREPYKDRPKVLPEGWQDVFLNELRMVPIVARACRAASISRMSSWRYRDQDEEFASAWDDALEEGKEKHLELLVNMRDAGNERIAMFLSRIWNLNQTAAEANRENKVVVGWEN